MNDHFRLSRLLDELSQELLKAQEKHAKMHGPHEGYAVILEELDELWDEVRAQRPDKERMTKEALQVAAMGLRFILDVCGYGDNEGVDRG
jgi:hypothetical protein